MRPPSPPNEKLTTSPGAAPFAGGGGAVRPIVHVVAPRRAASAVAVQVTRLAIRQAEAGLPVALIAPPAVGDALSPMSGVWRAAAPFRTVLDPLTVVTLRRTFKLWVPAAVHAHGVAALAAARVALAGMPAVPLLVSRRLAFPAKAVSGALLRSRAVSTVLASCQAVARMLTESAHLPAAAVRICRDGADLPWLETAAAHAARWRATLGLSGARPLVVHVGVRSWRGGGEILRAWPTVVRRLPEARLVLAGCASAADSDEVLDLAAEMGVAGTVTVTQAGLDTPELLAAADVVADASWAGAGVSAAVRDAMTLGRPVVAVARDGNLELVQAGITGLLVPPRDAPTLAAALIRLATDAALAVRLASAAREVIRRDWSLAAQLAELEGLHRKLGVPAGAPRVVTPADR